jgi:cytochrome c6
MRNLFTFLFAIIMLLIGCNATNGSDKKLVESPPDGKDIFKKFCVLCHGQDGKKGLNGALDLTASLLNLEEQMFIIREGKGLMAPYKELLSQEEINAVATFTQSLKQ